MKNQILKTPDAPAMKFNFNKIKIVSQRPIIPCRSNVNKTKKE